MNDTQKSYAETDRDATQRRAELVIRKMPFEFSGDINPHWNPGKREWSHMVNGASLAMPFLEPVQCRRFFAGCSWALQGGH